jgi:hypothetical protein
MTSKKDRTRVITARLEPVLYKALATHAVETGRSVSDIVRDAIRMVLLPRLMAGELEVLVGSGPTPDLEDRIRQATNEMRPTLAVLDRMLRQIEEGKASALEVARQTRQVEREQEKLNLT